ncbi:hypothetical protein LCGC14_2536020, partial [marine sediment metagenome]
LPDAAGSEKKKRHEKATMSQGFREERNELKKKWKCVI